MHIKLNSYSEVVYTHFYSKNYTTIKHNLIKY